MTPILHIGLHKTATKFYQHRVFPFLDKDKYVYNPPILTQYLIDYLKADEWEQPSIKDAFMAEYEIFNSSDNRQLIISRELMSGDLFSAYEDWGYRMSLLHSLIPVAKIIISLRYQPDWLISCYRESIHEHHYQHIKSFLRWDDNYQRFSSESNTGELHREYISLDALRINYTHMINTLYSLFGKEHVFVMFYEHFRNNMGKEYKKMLNIIGSEYYAFENKDTTPNRGYSALAIKISIARKVLLTKIGLDSIIHRPIRFFGPGSIPAGNIHLSILNKQTHWGTKYLRDNEEVRDPTYPNISLLKKIKMEFTWRTFIKKRLDKIIYKDWDILGELRTILDVHYKNINEQLVDLLGQDEVPNRYL